jgi:hypothetical protein
MKIAWRRLVPCILAMALAGCYSTQNPPLVFLQATTVGISASTTGSSGTPELALGYRDIDVALVPVTDEAGRQIRAKNPNPNAGGKGKFEDALSVFGQFQVNTNAGAQTSAGLGKFFATGLAAEQLAVGFKYKEGGTPIPIPKAGAAPGS